MFLSWAMWFIGLLLFHFSDPDSKTKVKNKQNNREQNHERNVTPTLKHEAKTVNNHYNG